MYYPLNQIVRCATCSTKEPEMRTPTPNQMECPACHSLARELPCVIRQNGRELTVCRTCAEFGTLLGAASRPAPGQRSLF